MRPFLLGILKCSRCSFAARLGLVCAKAKILDGYTISSSGSRLSPVLHSSGHSTSEASPPVSSCNACLLTPGCLQPPVAAGRVSAGEVAMSLKECLSLTEEEVRRFVEGTCDEGKVNELLFCVDVLEGATVCLDCGLRYPIKNSIVDTVDVEMPGQ